MNFPEFWICMSNCNIFTCLWISVDETHKGKEKPLLYSWKRHHWIICWKLLFISWSLIMSHLKVPVVQIKVEAKTLKQYVLVVWKLDIFFSMCLVPMCKIKKFHHKPWSGRKSGHFLNNWSVCPSCYSFSICFQFRCPDLGIVSLSVVYAAHCNALVGVWGKIWSRLQGVLGDFCVECIWI